MYMTFPGEINNTQVFSVGGVSIQDEKDWLLLSGVGKINEVLKPIFKNIGLHPSTFMACIYSTGRCTI